MSNEPLALPEEGFSLIPLHLIDDPARPLRSDLSEDSVTDLVLSIKQMGIIEPLVVKPVGDRFEVIAGHRRLFASQIAKLELVPCIIKKIGIEEGEVMKLHENIYRVDISPIDEAKHFDYMIQQLKMTPAKVAAWVGKSPSYISDRLAIFNYPAELYQALADKKIVFSVARAFARHPDPAKIKQFLLYAISNGITPAVAQKWVQDDIRDMENRNNPSTPTSTDYPTNAEDSHQYHCTLCKDPIDIANLTVTYMHDHCHQDLQKELESAPSSGDSIESVPAPTATS